MPNTPSVTLTNGAVVRVGDKVPMLRAGCWYEVEQISGGMLRTSDNEWFNADGTCHSHAYTGDKIDLAKLAALQARAPGEREAMRVLAGELLTALKTVLGDADHGQGMTWNQRISAGRRAIERAEIALGHKDAAALEALARKEG